MSTREELTAALAPVLAVIAGLDLRDPDAARRALSLQFPVDGPLVRDLQARFAGGRAARLLCDKEAGGVRFSRVQKPTTAAGPTSLSVDAVHMAGPGPGHTHDSGEVDLCFAVDGDPRFDGHPAGWTVYPPGSWHVPTVTGGTMDILYFLPGGAIRFDARP